MRVLLTGAGGFIGAQVARALLARGAEVHAVVRDRSRAPRLAAIERELTIHEADLVDEAAAARVIDAAKPETCVHGAWYAVPAPVQSEHGFRGNVNTDSGHREHGFRGS